MVLVRWTKLGTLMHPRNSVFNRLVIQNKIHTKKWYYREKRSRNWRYPLDFQYRLFCDFLYTKNYQRPTKSQSLPTFLKKNHMQPKFLARRRKFIWQHGTLCSSISALNASCGCNARFIMHRVHDGVSNHFSKAEDVVVVAMEFSPLGA